MENQNQNQNQKNQNQIVLPEIINFQTTKFENESIKSGFKNNDNKFPDDVKQTHTIKVQLNTSNVTADEFINNFVISTTTPNKMYQNNFLSGLKEQEILDLAKTVQKVSLREMLDNRKSRKLTSQQKLTNNIRNEVKKTGKSKQEVIDEMKKQLALLEAETE